MSITRQDAAAARAAAAKKAEAGDRLSALEVERRGYVQRGDEKGIKAVDDEIAHWSRVAGIPVESGTSTSDVKAADGDSSAGDEPAGDQGTGSAAGEQTPEGKDSGEQSGVDAAATGKEPAPKSQGRAKAAASAKD